MFCELVEDVENLENLTADWLLTANAISFNVRSDA